MKRTLYAICALAMSLTAFAQKLDTPKGKLIDNMYRTSDSWVKRNWTSTEPGRYEGLVSKIVVGDDNCLYVYNPLSGLDSKSWLKLDKIGEGKYRANLPQVIYKDDNGDDDDDEGGSSERIFKLNRMSAIADNQYKVVAANNNFMDFSWDGKTLKMLGTGTKNDMLGAVFNDKTWDSQYGDWNVTIETFGEEPLTPPISAPKKQYMLTSKTETSPRIVEVATHNNDIYVKGIFANEKLANLWVKLTKEGNKAVLPTNQYLGTAVKTYFKRFSNDMAQYHAYAAAFNDENTVADKLEFNIDPATGALTNDKILKVVLGKSSSTNMPKEDFGTLQNLVLTPYEQKAGKPEKPTLHYCSAAPSYDYSTTTITLAFYVRSADINGNYLDPNKMYYNVYINDNQEPFKFTRARYPYIEKDMTNILFNYQDKRNDDIKVADNQRILHFYDETIKKLSVVMVYEADGKKYSSEPMTTQIVSTGIDNATINNAPAPQQYYSVDGCRRQQLEKGLNIVKYSDGTTKKVLVK